MLWFCTSQSSSEKVKLKWNIRALRAMIAEFVFFVCIAAICFSGLLFTLHTLSADGAQPWSWRSIAWLMVQVWFGNTYLSFAQAASFHPIFGPFLMTGFAALSNTLLLTSKSEWHGAGVLKPQENSWSFQS